MVPYGLWVPAVSWDTLPDASPVLLMARYLACCGGRLLGPAVFFMTLGDIAQALQFLSQLPLF